MTKETYRLRMESLERQLHDLQGQIEDASHALDKVIDEMMNLNEEYLEGENE